MHRVPYPYALARRKAVVTLQVKFDTIQHEFTQIQTRVTQVPRKYQYASKQTTNETDIVVAAILAAKTENGEQIALGSIGIFYTLGPKALFYWRYLLIASPAKPLMLFCMQKEARKSRENTNCLNVRTHAISWIFANVRLKPLWLLCSCYFVFRRIQNKHTHKTSR